jgi:hypothetical protein
MRGATNLEITQWRINSLMLADFHNILNRQKNYFSQLLNAHNVSDVRQLNHVCRVPAVLRFKLALQSWKSITLQVVIKPCQNLLRQVVKHWCLLSINSICAKEELPDQWKESSIVPIHKKVDKTACNNYCGISLLSTPYKLLLNILLSRWNYWGPSVLGFDIEINWR